MLSLTHYAASWYMAQESLIPNTHTNPLKHTHIFIQRFGQYILVFTADPLQFLMYSNMSLWLDTIILCVQCNTADTALNLHNFSLAYFQSALQCVQPLTSIYYAHHCSKSEQLFLN